MQIRAQHITPGMTIRYADAWFEILAISPIAGRPLLLGSVCYLAEVLDEHGMLTSLIMHGDAYGYRVRSRAHADEVAARP